MRRKKIDQSLQKGAEERASLSAYLNNHPGEHKASTIAEALGWTMRQVGYRAFRMAEAGLIHSRREGNANYYSTGHSEPVLIRTRGSAGRAVANKNKKLAPVIGTTGEVELVIEGFTVVMGRNPQSGRFRIILETVS